MSEVSQGPGWWIASDGKWYPPELHPEAPQRQAPPQPAPPMSAPAQRQGFVDPWVAAAQAQAQAAAAAGGATTAAPGPQAGTAAAGHWLTGRSGGRSKRNLPRKPLLVGAAVVGVIAVAGILFAVLGGSSSSLTTPQGTASAVIGDFESGNLPAVCSVVVPSTQQACRSQMIFAGLAKISATNLQLGKTTTEGTEALVVLTGTVCISSSIAGNTQSQCHSNSDPNAALDHGQSFSAAYAAATSGNGAGPGFTFPLVEQNGQWYLQTTP